MAFSLIVCASAETYVGNVAGTLTSTSTYVNVTSPSCVVKKDDSTQWNAPFNGSSASQRVVVRIYKYGEDLVSATWVYSGISYTPHGYKTVYQDVRMDVFLGAKVDDRDEGPITISGTFNANYNNL